MTIPKKRSLLMSATIISILLDGVVFPWFVWRLVSMICLFWLAIYAYKTKANFWISIFGFAAVIYGPVGGDYLFPPFSFWYYFPIRLAAVAVLTVSWFTWDLPDEFHDKWGGVS